MWRNRSFVAGSMTSDPSALPPREGPLMKRLPWLARLPCLLPLVGPLLAQDTPDKADAKVSTPAESIEIPDVVKGITARELGGHMKFLASDLMRGRDTASAEIRLAGRVPRQPALGRRRRSIGRFGSRVGRPISSGSRSKWSRRSRKGPASRSNRRSDRLEDSSRSSSAPTSPSTRRASPRRDRRRMSSSPAMAGQPRKKVDDYEGLDVKNRFVLVLAGNPPAGAEGRKRRVGRGAAQTKGRPGRSEPAGNGRQREPRQARAGHRSEGAIGSDRRPATDRNRPRPGPVPARRPGSSDSAGRR